MKIEFCFVKWTKLIKITVPLSDLPNTTLSLTASPCADHRWILHMRAAVDGLLVKQHREKDILKRVDGTYSSTTSVMTVSLAATAKLIYSCLLHHIVCFFCIHTRSRATLPQSGWLSSFLVGPVR